MCLVSSPYSLGDVLPDGSVFLFVKSVDENDRLYRHYHTDTNTELVPESVHAKSTHIPNPTPKPIIPKHSQRVDVEGGFLFKPLDPGLNPHSDRDRGQIDPLDPVERPGISAEIAFRFDPNVSCCPEWV